MNNNHLVQEQLELRIVKELGFVQVCIHAFLEPRTLDRNSQRIMIFRKQTRLSRISIQGNGKNLKILTSLRHTLALSTPPGSAKSAKFISFRALGLCFSAAKL